MPAQPVNWNVVVRASWNLAILTPRGIGQRLFGVPAGTPLEVRVPLDGVSPYQVHHEGLAVIASADQLLIEPDVSDLASLERAMRLGSRAIGELPQTPYTAAGFNVRYHFDPVPDDLIELLRCGLDDRLADAELALSARKRSATWPRGDGAVNLEISLGDTSGLLVLNFHRASADVVALRQWLDMPMADVDAMIDQALGALGLMAATGREAHA